MPEFTYIARTTEGARKEGLIEAKNYATASEMLQNKELAIVKLSERDTSFDFMGPFLDRINTSFEKFKNRIPLNTIVFFTRQLSTMFSAGLTVEKALFFLAQEEKNKKFKKILNNIEKSIQRGALLSDALLKHQGTFSNLYISLVKAGEVSGKLSETLEELSLYLETVEDTQRKVKSAMYYPVFIVLFLGVMLFATFSFIIPQFSSVYDTLGSELPLYTTMLVDFGEWFNNNLFSVIFTTFISIMSIWIFTLTDTGLLLKDRFLLKLPIFGKLIEQNIMAKFSKTFGILTGAGVSVLETMQLIGRVVDNRHYELALIEASKNIENGLNISAALRETGIFPSILLQLLSTGEETGEIDNLALKASSFYTKQVNAIVDRLTSILEPLMIVLVGGVIGLIIVVTYLPIFHFGSALAQ
tara:strand:- start:2068 stop:3309 length:1242 start_codon:yes stop_codon:yes gene_type:complete